ncbi:MAG: 4-alpha-glucanotransferase [Acidobacteria bacterium]|nr:4-alpha-glucanotransferase [Acidobacteriota bacterium]
MKCDSWGILNEYWDARGVSHLTSEQTRQALRSAMGRELLKTSSQKTVYVTRPGEALEIPGGCDLTLEDGTHLVLEGFLPGDLPLGYHKMNLRGQSEENLLIVTPGRCYFPQGLRSWGWSLQLYSIRSRQSWGIGDFQDLKLASQWSAASGAQVLLLNPLHTPTPVSPLESSPYYPSSRCFLNPLYISVDQVPGAHAHLNDLESFAISARALNRERLIDRDRVWELKSAALRLLWSRFGGHPAFEAYCRERGQLLRHFAVFCVLAEKFGKDWRNWEADYRDPSSPAVGRFLSAHLKEVDFHRWLQWLADNQLKSASQEIGIIQDLPVGVDPAGYDAWYSQEVLALAARVGAPPDRFNTRGQDWGLVPFIPHCLSRLKYRPFIETLRASLRHSRGLRIDHVMGLFRLFWIPEGRQATEGAYVVYPWQDLLAIVDLESYRAGAVIVGEDLGTVEDHVRETLAAHSILSYRLLWFERCKPRDLPYLAVAAVTTHDLPTIAGLWRGSDLKTQLRLGLNPDLNANREIRDYIMSAAGLTAESSLEEVIEAIYRLLAQVPSAIIMANLEDALTVEERPNFPGTASEWPNWSIALPELLEELQHRPLAGKLARQLSRQNVANR